MIKSPTKEELLDIMRQLISGGKSRSEVAAWATDILCDDSIKVSNKAIFDALEKLGAVDLVSTDRPYLYQIHDFQVWYKQLENS